MFANHQNIDGSLLGSKAAAVDLLNIIRPIVAIGRYVCFCAFALHKHTEYRGKLANGNDEDIHYFVQEVRRFYPYFPFAAATVLHDFNWQGYDFKKNTRVLLDLYGTNRDRTLWEKADQFEPQRFASRTDNAFDLIPQGGGFYDKNHRCAGEWITLALMESSVKLLTSSMSYKVVDKNLSIDLSAMPTLPQDGFMISDIALIERTKGNESDFVEMNNYGTDKQGRGAGKELHSNVKRKLENEEKNEIKNKVDTEKNYEPRKNSPSESQQSSKQQAAQPSQLSVAGEEDPGAALEEFVDSTNKRNSRKPDQKNKSKT